MLGHQPQEDVAPALERRREVASAEFEVALEVERQLEVLLVSLPSFCELPIWPLRGADDLIRLELALLRFAEIHRSKRSKARIRAVRTILEAARARLRKATADRFELLGASAPTPRRPAR
jgi:hypothetical protein